MFYGLDKDSVSFHFSKYDCISFMFMSCYSLSYQCQGAFVGVLNLLDPNNMMNSIMSCPSIYIAKITKADDTIYLVFLGLIPLQNYLQ